MIQKCHLFIFLIQVFGRLLNIMIEHYKEKKYHRERSNGLFVFAHCWDFLFDMRAATNC